MSFTNTTAIPENMIFIHKYSTNNASIDIQSNKNLLPDNITNESYCSKTFSLMKLLKQVKDSFNEPHTK